MKGVWTDIKQWLYEAALVLRREFTMVLKDPGVILFFFALPLLYPILYAAIYNPEVAREIPVAVVDNCRTAESREFLRHADATEAIDICGYAANLEEAKLWWMEKKCYGVIEIPAGYSNRTGRGEQGVVHFYSDAGLMLRYRSFLSSLTDLQLATGAMMREKTINSLGTAAPAGMSAISTDAHFLGNPSQGFASSVLPGILVLILQQSLVLGVIMLAGTANERRRRNNGIDPLAIPASPSATVTGKTLCYVAIYLPLTIYVLHYIPVMFNFPHIGSAVDYLLLAVPMLIASALMAQAMQWISSERESSFVAVVFTSLVFLFLSGIIWPRYAMHPVWKLVGDIIPSTWGIEGFIRINNNGGTLALESTPYISLWLLCLGYFVAAYLVTRHITRHG